MSVFLKFSGRQFALSHNENIEKELQALFLNLNIDSSTLSLQCNGKPLRQLSSLQINDTVTALIPLKGGKGGFGAKLKNQGGKKIRPNDNRFSRDAQGRRIQYQMAEKEYAQYIKKKMEEDEKVNAEREKFKVMQQTMKQGNSFMKLDQKYNEELQKTESKLAQSIRIGREKLMNKKINGSTGINHHNRDEDQQKVEKKYSEQQKVEQVKSQKQECKLTKQGSNQDQKQEKQIQNISIPIKKVKLDQAAIKPQINSQKQTKPVLLSAKDKLKSLFKK